MHFDSYIILKRTLYIFYLNFFIKINSKKIKYVFLYYKTCTNYNVLKIGKVIQWRRYIWAWGARSPWKFWKFLFGTCIFWNPSSFCFLIRGSSGIWPISEVAENFKAWKPCNNFNLFSSKMHENARTTVYNVQYTKISGRPLLVRPHNFQWWSATETQNL